MKRQQNFKIKWLEHLQKVMTIYDTYSTDSFKEIVDAINHIHKNLAKYEKVLGGTQPYWHKENIMERRITCKNLNSFLYLHVLQMKYAKVYKDLIRKFAFMLMQSTFLLLVICLFV